MSDRSQQCRGSSTDEVAPRRSNRLSSWKSLVSGIRRSSLIGASVGLVGVVVLFSGGLANGQDSDQSSQPFTASASGEGVEISTMLPGFPLTNEPVDVGGPTAQVAADSLGNSTGYAALPDPGEFVTTLPGLITGLVSGGALGLPPIPNLPSVPNYPLFIASNVSSNPNASLGAGPYSLTAHSTQGGGTVSASGGLQTGVLGNVALVSSSSSITSSSTGIVATATSDLQGLTLGPLTIGEIKSVATETLDSSGTVTPTSSLAINGVSIGGLGVSLSTGGLNVVGTTVPLPINSTLMSLLSGAHVTAQLQTVKTFPNTVEAPALVITSPLDLGNASTAPGTLTITIGGATASLQGSAVAPAATTGNTGITGSTGGGAVNPTSITGNSGGGGTTSLPASSAAPSITSTTTPVTSTTIGSGPPTRVPTETVGFVGLFSIRSLYLVVIVGALVALALGQIIRLLGVRKPWTSGVG
jgi:hypothetical protein